MQEHPATKWTKNLKYKILKDCFLLPQSDRKPVKLLMKHLLGKRLIVVNSLPSNATELEVALKEKDTTEMMYNREKAIVQVLIILWAWNNLAITTRRVGKSRKGYILMVKVPSGNDCFKNSTHTYSIFSAPIKNFN